MGNNLSLLIAITSEKKENAKIIQNFNSNNHNESQLQNNSENKNQEL